MTNNDDNLDEGFEDLDAATEEAADNAPVMDEEGGDALAAPSRSMTSGGGSKKTLFILLGVVAVLALGGGGAYMFLMGDDDVAPSPVAAVPPAAAPSEATFAANDPTAAPVDPAAPLDAGANAAPPMPDALATAPAADPAADPAAMPAETMPPADAAVAAVDPAMPAADPAAMASADPAAMPPADPAAMTSTDPAAMPPADAAVAAADPAAVPPADLGAPPAEENVAMPLETMPPADTAATPSADATAPPVDTASAPVTPAPTEPPPDLPMPEQAVQTPVTTTVTTTTTQPAGTTTTTTTTGMSDPNAAELAIVQNAAILDQVTQPNTAARPFDPAAPTPSQTNAIKEVDKLLRQEAIIRPLPPAWLQVSKNRDAGDMDSRLTAARSALAQNRNSAALQLFTELKEKYPKDGRVLMGRAVALQKLGQNEEALGAYEAVLIANPKSLEALTNMLGLLKGKDPQLAVSKLTELHETYPYQADITAQLGVAHAQAGDYEQALRFLDMAEAMDPGSAYILYNKAVLHDKMGHNTQAGDLYRQLIRMSVDGTLDENLPLDHIKRRLSVMR